jgi:4'-phosphopantetheinyl transferase
MSSTPAAWPSPPARLSLESAEVHVWLAKLDQPTEILRALHHLLSPDEIARAERFHFRKHREHFTVARGVLRTILGGYLSVEPSQLRFAYSAYGKPALVGIKDQPTLRFNLSHSHELALYGFTLGREIGLDLEYRREDFATGRIAEQFFSAREVEMLRALPTQLRTEGFFNCWTRKEAYIKAVGLGLSLPLDQFDVSLSPFEPAALLRTGVDEREAARWSLKALTTAEGYSAALAVEGHDWQLKCWRWTSPDNPARI